MTKLEVEHRGYLTQKKFNKLNRFFKKMENFLGIRKDFLLFIRRGEKKA